MDAQQWARMVHNIANEAVLLYIIGKNPVLIHNSTTTKERLINHESLADKKLIVNPITKSPSMIDENLHYHHL